MKSGTLQNSILQNSISQAVSVLFRVFLPPLLLAGLIGTSSNIAISAEHNSEGTVATLPERESPILVATAYTNITLPTLRRGDRGRSVQLLQRILVDDGFLGAAGARVGNPSGAVVDGVFGSVTESAVRDLQQRYNVPVTGQVNPRTWEALDRYENPYRSALPWKL